MENNKIYTLRPSSHMWRQSAGNALQLPLSLPCVLHPAGPEFLFLHCT